MAALIRHAFLNGALARSAPTLLRTTNPAVIPVRGSKMKKPPQKPKKKPTIESIMASIESKGFLRPYKPYTPPEDAAERVSKICQSHDLSTDDNTPIEDLELRFHVFVKCEEELGHEIPNSMLTNIKTVGDLKKFYETPVSTTTPYEKLKDMDLPPNLHVQQEAVRFHPDDDKIFGGKTAFPQSATLVTGLKYKDKYRGHRPEKPWPEYVKHVMDI